MTRARPPSPSTSPGSRVDTLDWPELARHLDADGHATTGPLLTPAECAALAALDDQPAHFRSTVDLSRHRFGAGRYRYFAYPLPPVVEELRTFLYPHLVPIARDWASRLGRPAPWPDTLDEWLERCHRAGQTRPTPILLRYGPGGWNALHQDLYGELVFPLQVVVGLDEPGVDYEGGELLLVEQRPRAQSRGHATTIGQGRGVLLTTAARPVPSARGWSTASVRHGVSTVRSGRRRTLGLLFHDAA